MSYLVILLPTTNRVPSDMELRGNQNEDYLHPQTPETLNTKFFLSTLFQRVVRYEELF